MPIEPHPFASRKRDAALLARDALALARAGGVSAGLKSQTCCVTFLAGAGTRWVKSLVAAKKKLDSAPIDDFSRLVAEFPIAAPRGLFPVRNFITSCPPRIPMAAYAIDAFKGLGRQMFVVRGWEAEIQELILDPLGIDGESTSFFTQNEGPSGKMLGHGDAARQSMRVWGDSRYVLANFGGDANSPLTALASLLALEELEAAGEKIGLLLPVAEIEHPAYPVILDDEGLPRAFGHNKLGGAGAPGMGKGSSKGISYANVGIRAYRRDALVAAIEEIVASSWSEKLGYSIPGNDPDGHEFALDNVDALLASRGEARILAIAKPEELSPAKSFEDIGSFEMAVKKVREEWTQFLSASDPEQLPYRRTSHGIDNSRS
ncbi:MAG: hypothetical protein ACYC2S_10325 [Spirochaetales bacterium]